MYGTTQRDHAHIELTYAAAFYFTQPDVATLTSLLEMYAGYPADVLDRMQFVLVDDGSPVPVDVPTDLNLNLLVLRIREDRPWNQPGARNLALTYARSDKVVVSDLDHYFPPETLRALVKRRSPKRTFYRFRSFEQDGTPRRKHPNTFLLSRARFLGLYGYDEDYCGHYGFDDTMIWRWQRYNGTRFLTLGKDCKCIPRLRADGTSDHALARDLEHNRELARRKREAWRAFGPARGHSRRFLDFEWDVVCDLARDARPPDPPRRPLWTRTWLLRWLLPA